MTVTFKQHDEPAIKKRPIVVVDLQKLDIDREEAVVCPQLSLPCKTVNSA